MTWLYMCFQLLFHTWKVTENYANPPSLRFMYSHQESDNSVRAINWAILATIQFATNKTAEDKKMIIIFLILISIGMFFWTHNYEKRRHLSFLRKNPFKLGNLVHLNKYVYTLIHLIEKIENFKKRSELLFILREHFDRIPALELNDYEQEKATAMTSLVKKILLEGNPSINQTQLQSYRN